MILPLLVCMVVVHQAYAQNWEKTTASGYYYSTIEKTKYGILAGELDTRNKTGIYNGVLISQNFGSTWVPFGLENRGITCISAWENTAVFGTYYNEINQSGLYLVDLKTNEWQNLNFPYYTSSVYTNGSIIIAGTTNKGIWISYNQGETWVQKTGQGTSSPPINAIKGNSSLILAVSTTGVKASTDSGHTWYEIPEFQNKNIRHLSLDDDFIAVSTFTNDGIYFSVNNGGSWAKANGFGNVSAGGLEYFKNCIYAGKPGTSGYYLYESCDQGNTWSNTGRVSVDMSTRINDLEMVFSEPDVILAAVNGEGISRINIDKEYNKNPIFSRPWQDRTLPLIDYITSYMDHEYPLLGSSIEEPEYAKSTTYNFLGKRESEPKLYYSSHNGTDFKLPYGTQVLSVADGIATYKTCRDCGNTIVVDHQNGYQTQYMHLQMEDLITQGPPIAVTTGQPIGKVGMTGKTSGPHLHFITTYDRQNNGTFSDDFPWGINDPFGWQSDTQKDPWPEYTYSGNNGTVSSYLWNEAVSGTNIRITPNIVNTASISNLELIFPQDTFKENATMTVFNYIRPRNTFNQYIPGTSYIIEVKDILGNQLKTLNKPLEIIFDIEGYLPDFINPESLGVYYYDDLKNVWIQLESFLDIQNQSLHAKTNHLSNFAVFGDPSSEQAPHTSISLEGIRVNGWYKAPPIISLTSNSENNLIWYSLDLGNYWEQYVLPFEYSQEGITTFLYKSINNDNQEEQEQEIQIRLDSSGSWRDSITVKENTFSTEPNQ